VTGQQKEEFKMGKILSPAEKQSGGPGCIMIMNFKTFYRCK
jgi:hypothetical protein